MAPRGRKRRTGYQEAQRRNLVFEKDIAMMMYGFGDVREPLQESVEVLDEMLGWFVADLCSQATKKASMSTSSNPAKLKTSDFLMALEGQPKMLARAHELLNLDKVLKEARATFQGTLTG